MITKTNDQKKDENSFQLKWLYVLSSVCIIARMGKLQPAAASVTKFCTACVSFYQIIKIIQKIQKKFKLLQAAITDSSLQSIRNNIKIILSVYCYFQTISFVIFLTI